MKVKLDIECTPEEARRFMGLPDVSEMQNDLVRKMHEKLGENIQNMDTETLMKTWLPMTIQGMSDMQKIFWQSMKTASPDSDDDEESAPESKK